MIRLVSKAAPLVRTGSVWSTCREISRLGQRLARLARLILRWRHLGFTWNKSYHMAKWCREAYWR